MGVELDGVTKRFGATVGVEDVTIKIPQGTFFCIVGPSGCGKSTLLRLIAGLERPDRGIIRLGNDVVASPDTFIAPEERAVGVVFQSYALWPHMTVQQNVAFPYEAKGVQRSRALELAQQHLQTVSLSDYANRKPEALSGGQRQRVALARCLAGDAQTVLMDEPLANLDPHLRGAMEEELRAFHAESGVTTVFITHDQREAMALADLMAVMDRGHLVQVGAPEEIYERPATEMVARFIGRGAIIPATIADGQACFPGRNVPVENMNRDGTASVFVRPQQISIDPNGFPVRVTAVTYRGGYWEASAEGLVGGAEFALDLDQRVSVGEALAININGAWVLSS